MRQAAADCWKALCHSLLIGGVLVLAVFGIGCLVSGVGSGIEAAKDAADLLTAGTLFFLAGTILLRTKPNEKKEKERDARIRSGMKKYAVLGIHGVAACYAAGFLILAVVLDFVQRALL